MFAAEVLGLSDKIPMTYSTHWALSLFAEGMTGIPEIDSARVKMILVPRGLGKSSLITKAQATHDLIKYDDYAIGLANEKAELAENFLAAVKDEFATNELLQALWPERIPDFKTTTWKANQATIARKSRRRDPSLLATGVGGTVTGVHMDKWYIDDVISQNAAENARAGSFSEIDATNRWLTRLEPLLTKPKKDPITIIGTRWWEGDTYEWLEGNEDTFGLWGHGEKKQEFNWQITLPDGSRQTIRVYRRGELAVFRRPAIEDGRSIFPERYTLDDLELMSRQDPVFYASQYLLEPTAGGASEFRDTWLKNYMIEGNAVRFLDNDGRPKYAPFREMNVLISVDPAFSKKSDSARTAIPVTGVWHNHIFLLEDFAERGMGLHDISQKVVDFCLRYPVKKIFVETVVAQITVANAIKDALQKANLPYIVMEEISSHGMQKKNMRIYGLEPFFRTGHFYINNGRSQRFIQEYNSFPRGGLRDILDALAFQKDEWEKMSQFAGYAGVTTDASAQIQADIARIRNNMRRRMA
jgi:hypothetical protein